MDLQEITADSEKVDGVWIDYGDDAKFLIASSDSKPYQKAIAKITKKYAPHKVRKDTATQTEIAVESMAQAMLLDFKGITDSGKKLTNTIENRRKILKSSVMRNWIADQATDISNFISEGEADDIADLKSED